MGEACGTYGAKINAHRRVLRELDHFKYQDIDMRIMLKCILKR